MIVDPVFYALAVCAVLIVGISKGGFGGGLGVVGVPLMSLVISPFRAAAILLPILCVMDLVGLWVYRRQWNAANLKVMIPGAAAGVLVGALTYQYTSEDAIRLLVGAIAIAFALNQWLRPHLTGTIEPGSRPVRGGLWGAVAGFTSFAAHAGGPPADLYLLPQRLRPAVFVGTTVVFFAFVNYIKLVPYAWLGQFRTANLTTALVLLPLAPLGVWLGVVMNRRISAVWFYRVCYVLLFITGLRLAWEGGRGILAG